MLILPTPAGDLLEPQFCPLCLLQALEQVGHRHMRYWTSQIVIGIIVTVVGTIIADLVIKSLGGRRQAGVAPHYSGPARAGR